jgi:hypothetical protein
MPKKLKLSSDGGTLVARNVKKLRWGPVESAFGGSMESGVRFYVVLFGRNLVSVAGKVISHLIYFIKIFIGLYVLVSVRFANMMLCNELYVTEQVYFRQLLWAILGQYKQ